MTVQRIERDEVATRAVEVLGLKKNAVELFSTEGLCASLRRAASFMCPASPRQIVDTVMDALKPLSTEMDREIVVEALDALVMAGDLLELRQGGAKTRLMFLGPPSFVEKHAGEYLLLGVRPRAAALLNETDGDLDVFHDAHTRSVLLDAKTAVTTLTNAGLRHIPREQWIKAPRVEGPSQVLEKVRAQLESERAPGAVSGLSLIDTSRSVRFYKGRWRESAAGDRGLFVGRRPQAYGAPIWCAVEMAGGVPQAVLDLPVDSSVAPGWDEARRIQAALDANNGAPQVYRTRPAGMSGREIVIDFFGPLPIWAERYLAISGRPVPKGPKSLFSYGLPLPAVDEAKHFLSSSLWMTAIKEEQAV